MQTVSEAYKASMKSALRERAYIMISFGLVNREAQTHASVASGSYLYYSNSDIFRKKAGMTAYATLEDSFCKADGSLFFPPPQSAAAPYFDTGLVSEKLVSDEVCTVTMSLNITGADIKGLTIQFGENYPVDFDVVSGSQTLTVRGNDKAEWVTEEVFENATSIKLIARAMKYPHNRLRIYSILFGYGLVYYNDSVMESSMETYLSPIGAEVPQIDFSVVLKNYDHYFNVDNPKSAINYLETGQEMEIAYGYRIPGTDTIEWIPGNRLWCSEWESDDTTATIRCQDIFRAMDGEYAKGQYISDGKSYYELAQAVLADAGITDYYLDPRLQNLYSCNPLPRTAHKEALQIIANACRCILSQSREGQLQIRSNFFPEITASANTTAVYAHLANILNPGERVEYASFAKNYTKMDGSMYFYKAGSEPYLRTGYVSSSLSNASGSFTTKPLITLTMDALRTYYCLELIFGSALPSGFIVRTYNDSTLVKTVTITSGIEKRTVLRQDFGECNKMTLEFTGTAIPYNRITLDRVILNDTADFTMTRTDMTSSPRAVKQERVKEVIVPCYTYQESGTLENLVSSTVTVSAGDEETYYLSDASYGYTAKLDGSATGISITAQGSYFVTVKYTSAGTFQMEISGYRYQITERYAVALVNSKGKSAKWENPMISDMTMARELANWLAEYYASGIEYEYNTRGNPELDAGDTIYQENEFQNGMTVNVYRHTIGFKQSFSGSVTVRRTGG